MLDGTAGATQGVDMSARTADPAPRRLDLAGALIAAVVLLAAAACGSGSDASSTAGQVPSSTPSEPAPSPSPPVSVDGAGYHFTTPAGWTFTPAKGNWEEGHGNYPDLETPGFAEFFAPNVTADIVIGRRAATGLTLQAWIAALTRSGTLEYPAVFCRPPESVRSSDIAGEHAQLRRLRCPGVAADGGGVLLLAVHHGYGYALLCFSRESGTSASFPAQCREWLSTFRFTA